MFKKTDGASKESDDVQTLIGPSIEVRGDFEGMGDVVVEGKLFGTLKTKKDLRIGAEAVIDADVEAENIYITGEVKGNIKARETIEMGENSKVTGDIETKSIMIERGAVFNGSCVMTEVGDQTSDVGSQKSEIDEEEKRPLDATRGLREKKKGKKETDEVIKELYEEDVK